MPCRVQDIRASHAADVRCATKRHIPPSGLDQRVPDPQRMLRFVPSADSAASPDVATWRGPRSDATD